MGWDIGSGMGEIGVPIMMTPVQGSPAFQINDPIVIQQVITCHQPSSHQTLLQRLLLLANDFEISVFLNSVR